jgi:hypothetical protein
MRTESKTKDSGSGDWETGFNCPGVHFNGVDNGPAVLLAKPMIAGTTAEDKLGMVLKFSTAVKPLLAANSVAFGNKIYIPWRNFNKEAEYTNPWNSNKYIDASILSDDGNKYSLKIMLPYKTLGYYISDTQGKQIATKIETMSTNLRSKVSSAKGDVVKSTNNLISSNEAILLLAKSSKVELISKTEKNIKAFEDEKKKLESDLAAADATAATAGAAYETSQKDHKEKKDNLDSKNAQIYQTNAILTDLRKENNDSKKTLVEIKNKSTADLETKIALIRSRHSED